MKMIFFVSAYTVIPLFPKKAVIRYSSSMEKPLCAFAQTPQDMKYLGWDRCDYIIVSGDAYADHPSFGTAIIARLLESLGNRTGLICQPSWDSDADFRVLGRPAKAFLVTSGAVDSMVAHYTASKKLRSTDACSPGGRAGLRPNRAVITYTARIRQAFKGVLVIAGGLEASLRRLSHYDYWSDTIRRSILLDAKLDAVIYGMAERQVRQIDEILSSGGGIKEIQHIRGIVYASSSKQISPLEKTEDVILPNYHEVSGRDKKSNIMTDEARLAFARSVNLRLIHENPMKPCRIIEPNGGTWVVQNPPPEPLSEYEMDQIYALPFTRRTLNGTPDIPSMKEVLFSITSSRGCCGSCTFCSLRTHQGRTVQSRSRASILREAKKMSKDPLFKGIIHDVGGPTANFRNPACKRHTAPGKGPCSARECLFPDHCRSFQDDHEEYLQLLTDLRKLPGISKVFVRSGIRYDHLLYAHPDKRKHFLKEFCMHHVSGQLKTAPEHVSPKVLDAMGKPPIQLYNQFSQEFKEAAGRAGKTLYLLPYFISSHPGASLREAVELAEYLRDSGFIPDQIQDFYPTPGTVASCMYASGIDPRPGRNFSTVYIPKGRERTLQRALLHFHKPNNRKLVIEALKHAGRTDLIGNSRRALVKRTGKTS